MISLKNNHFLKLLDLTPEEIATFGESDYNQADAAGFINLYGLPIKVQAMVNGKK